MQKIRTLQELQSHLSSIESDRYWQTLHSLIPIIRYVKQYTHQKDIAPYLGLHPAKLSSFIAMTRALTITSLNNSPIDMKALQEDIERKWSADA